MSVTLGLSALNQGLQSDGAGEERTEKVTWGTFKAAQSSLARGIPSALISLIHCSNPTYFKIQLRPKNHSPKDQEVFPLSISHRRGIVAPSLKKDLRSYNSKSTVTTVLWPGHRTSQENIGMVSSQPSLSSLTFTALRASAFTYTETTVLFCLLELSSH